MPFLLQAPTIAVGAPLTVAVHRPGEAPKSLSGTRSAGGTVQVPRWASERLNFTIEKPSLADEPLPVVMKTDLPLVVGLDQMLAPFVPGGVVQNVFSSVPVDWLNSFSPPRTSGTSHSELTPTEIFPPKTSGDPHA